MLSSLANFIATSGYEKAAARAAKHGLTFDQMLEVDHYMCHVWEAMIHTSNAGFIALATLNPALIAVALQCGFLSSWLFATHKPLDDLGDAVAESENDAQYLVRCTKLTIGCAVVCGVVLFLGGSILATTLMVVF